MRITKQMREWLIANKGVDKDASDDEFRKAAGEALASGELTTEKFMDLSKSEEDDDADEFVKRLDKLVGAVDGLTKKLSEKETPTKSTGGEEDEDEDEDEEEEEPSKSKKSPKTKGQPSMLTKMVASLGMQMSLEDKDIDIRVKEAAEMYQTTKSAMTFPKQTKTGQSHPLAGRPVIDFTEKGGRHLETASELDMAVAGSFCKMLAATAQRGNCRNFGFQALPQHDKELLLYAAEKMNWGGASDGGTYSDINNRKLTELERKALFDDSTSGGMEAAPIAFDDLVISTPLLYGELYPLVNTIPLDRGRRIEGVATGTVTGSWGGVDDTAVSLFNTASYVSAFDTTIYRWQGAIRIGLDFLSDTPIDFAQHVTQQYGERLLEDLDDVVASGNGTTQPEGVINKSGATSVTFGGTTTIGAYESLRFGVAKNEHRANVVNTAVFCGTEVSYQAAMAIPVGASDSRRLSQTVNLPNYDGYSWIGRAYKINESLTNSQIFYAILARYRMYRRRGFTMRSSTEGDTLIRANELLLVALARYGGQMERGACAAITTDAPA